MQGIVWLIGVLFLLFWFILHPARCNPAQKNLVYGVNCAHRGLHTPDRTVPENSMAAFRAAVDAGYGIELDIQLSKDGEVVVFHDDTLQRVCGVQGFVHDYTLAELQRMSLCGTRETIPTFQAVLQQVNGAVPLIVELKNGKKNNQLCEKAADMLDNYGGAFCIESFAPAIVRWFRKNRPDVLRGQLSDNASAFVEGGQASFPSFLLGNLFTNVIARPHFIAYGPGQKSIFVRFALACGALSVCWTVRPEDDPPQKEAECDVVIFEFYKPEPIYKRDDDLPKPMRKKD